MSQASFESTIAPRSIKATSTLASSQFFFVKLDSNGQIVVAGNGQNAIGVVQDAPAAGSPGSVCRPGDITKVICGNTVTAGQDVQSDGAGKCVPAVSGSFVLGYALTAGASAGMASIIFQPKASKL